MSAFVGYALGAFLAMIYKWSAWRRSTMKPWLSYFKERLWVVVQSAVIDVVGFFAWGLGWLTHALNWGLEKMGTGWKFPAETVYEAPAGVILGFVVGIVGVKLSGLALKPFLNGHSHGKK